MTLKELNVVLESIIERRLVVVTVFSCITRESFTKSAELTYQKSAVEVGTLIENDYAQKLDSTSLLIVNLKIQSMYGIQ